MKGIFTQLLFFTFFSSLLPQTNIDSVYTLNHSNYSEYFKVNPPIQEIISSQNYNDMLTGNWNGKRNSLNQFGLHFDITYTGEFFSQHFSKSNYLDNTSIKLNLDFEKLLHLEKTELLFSVLGNNGRIINNISSIQGVSNIESYNSWRIYEFWIEKLLINNSLSIKFGLYDLNSEFDVRESSSLFINPSQGIGPDFSLSGKNGPSIFPLTSLALRIKYEPADGFYFQTVILDGVPGDLTNPYETKVILNKEDGILLAAEFGLMKEANPGDKFAIGIWHYTTEFPDLLNSLDSDAGINYKNNLGGYVFAERRFTDNISAFIRSGISNKDINKVKYYLGSGLNYEGILQEDDVIGFAFASGFLSEKYNQLLLIEENKNISNETNFELIYSYKLASWLKLQTDLQLVSFSNNRIFHHNHLFLGGRFEIAL